MPILKTQSGGTLTLIALLAAGLWAPARAQEAPAPDAAGPPAAAPAAEAAIGPLEMDKPQKLPAPDRIDLDMVSLLTSAAVLSEQIEDPVWTLAAGAGRQFLQIPIVVAPQASAVELDASTLRLRGGRFLAWRLDGGEEGRGQDPGGADEMWQDQPPAGGLRGPAMSGGIMAVAPGEGQAVAAPASVSLDDSPPRLTRGITIEPDGRISWPLERYLTSAAVKEADNVYCLKIRSDLMARREPERPRLEPLASDAGLEQRRQHAQRLRDESDRYRQQMTGYQQLRRYVLAAPQRFDGPLPPRIWAVFELNPAVRDISFEGPPPLPWRLSTAQLNALRSAARPAGNVGTPSRELLTQLHEIIQLVAVHPHAFSLRAAAVALGGSGLMPLSQPNDSVHNLARTILEGPDPAARSLVIRPLLAMATPSEVSLDLMRRAARSPDPGTQILALRGLLRGGQAGQDQLKLLVDTANRVLADPTAPPAARFLAELFEAARTGDGEEPSPVMATLTSGVNFHIADPGRRDQAILGVLVHHNTQPLAMAWLDRSLLGSDDRGLAQRTLELIADATLLDAAASGAGRARAAARGYDEYGGDDFWAGDMGMDPQPGQGPQGRVEQVNGHSRLVLQRGLLLASGSHSLLKLLNAQDADLRGLAWRAVMMFDLPATEQAVARTGPDGQPMVSPVQALLDAAIQTRPTPPELVGLMARQLNVMAGTIGLARLTAQADPSVAHQAAALLVGSRRPLDQAMQHLTPEDCHQMAARIYEQQKMPWAVVTGLLRDRSRIAQLAPWFAHETVMGKVPPAAAWGQAFGGEQPLMQQTMAGDDPLALAAAAALVVQAGGSEEMAGEWSTQLRNQPNRSPDYAQGQWTQLRRDIYTQRLKSAAGTYRLTLKLYPANSGVTVNSPQQGYEGMDEFGGTWEGAMDGGLGDPAANQGAWGPATARPLWEEPLGIMQLEADGQSVKFANQTVTLSVPAQYLAIRIDKLVELKNFPNGKLAELPLERSGGAPLDLLPQSDGAWMGRAALVDGQVLELHMQPVKDAASQAGQPDAP